MKKLKYVLLFLAVVFSFMLFKNIKTENKVEFKAEVVSVNNDEVIKSGISSIGYQQVEIKLLDGEHKGKVLEATSNLMGKQEIDTYCNTGDIIMVALNEKEGVIKQAIVIEHYRQDWIYIMFLIFLILLIAYAGKTGFKAIASFILTVLIIWMILIPGLLNGKDPILLVTFVLGLLSAVIIFSVAGLNKKGLIAFLGTISGLIVTILITLFLGDKLYINGMTSPFAETLIYSGYFELNMQEIFYSAIILGASGAAMDIAMDIAASMEEIYLKKPDITKKEIIESGMNVGKAVIGTMTTTLLLAYSGGYLTLLMLFMTKDSSMMRILNLKIVSAEIMRTIVGSIGLVIVAPVTAIIAGHIYTSKGFEFSKLKLKTNK